MELIFLFFLIMVFLAIGSFSSVAIYRLILMEFTNTRINLFTPRSHCPKCKKNISLINLIPLFGFLIQQGKCINCKVAISYKYTLHEIIHLVAGLSIYFLFNINLFSILIYILFSIFYILFVCDIEKFYIPFYLNLLISIIGLSAAYHGNIFNIDTFNILNTSQFQLSLYGFIFGYSILWLINFCFKFLKKQDGIGGGDFLLLGGIGSLVGPIGLAPVIFIGSLATLFLGLIGKFDLKNELPLGSGLIIGLLIYLLIKFSELSLF
ncbi:prepilin peptidase [Gammaproteobacteria bacterium]|nr:prepilin peptidase [Gammaproteobacteria bacterium]